MAYQVQTTLIRIAGIAGLLLVMGVTTQGCRRPQSYYIGFINKTGHDLHEVGVSLGDKEASDAGELVKGGKATDGPVGWPFPSEAEVRWQENGARHAVKAKVKGAVPEGFTGGTIYFVINSDGTVDVKPVK